MENLERLGWGMPSAVWPPALPQSPRLEDLQETPPSLAIRTSMDVGPAKVRRRAVAGVTTWTMSLIVTAAQRIALLDFFTDVCEAGAVPFDWKNPSTGVPASFRWVGVPSIKAMSMRSAVGGGRHLVRFTLEELPAPSGEVLTPPGYPDEAGWRYSGDRESFGSVEEDPNFEDTAAGFYVSTTGSGGGGGPGVTVGTPKNNPLDPGGGSDPTGNDDGFDTNNPSSF
jgi:hypothetical protein